MLQYLTDWNLWLHNVVVSLLSSAYNFKHKVLFFNQMIQFYPDISQAENSVTVLSTHTYNLGWFQHDE